ncbi:MAG: ParB N-terminal domain-containing protein [Phycisphaerae bacterium]|nr:ParB N-terminal domain-containing protein [Phycisphaerae bacterium]
MVAKYILKEIPPEQIAFNEDNPRGETPEEIKTDKAFEQLKDSVAQFGVLVPIVVHEAKEGPQKYRLVDGERRLRAALATNIDTIPAHIAKSADLMGQRVQAFHIHMLRKQWKPVAIVRAFKTIRTELKKSKKWKSDKELLLELQALTGCTPTQLEDLQRGIHYPEKVLKDIDAKKLKWSHIVQFEASFVEQLAQHYPRLLNRLGAKKVREVLTEKARQKVIDPTRDLIDYMLPIFKRAKSAQERKAAERLFEKFISEPDCTPENTKLAYDQRFPPKQDQLELANNVIEQCDRLMPLVEQIETTQIISYKDKASEVKRALEALKQTVSKKVRQLARISR